jgi:hypothetical protein
MRRFVDAAALADAHARESSQGLIATPMRLDSSAAGYRCRPP